MTFLGGGGSKVFHILVTYKHLFNKKNIGQRNLKKSVVLLPDLVPKTSPKCNCLYPISMPHPTSALEHPERIYMWGGQGQSHGSLEIPIQSMLEFAKTLLMLPKPA